jgi:hypothetical protein
MDYDTELRLLNEVLRRAYDIDRHDHVLDIGCGAGQTGARRDDALPAPRRTERPPLLRSGRALVAKGAAP